MADPMKRRDFLSTAAAGPLAEEHVCLALSLRAELAPAEEAA